MDLDVVEDGLTEKQKKNNISRTRRHPLNEFKFRLPPMLDEVEWTSRYQVPRGLVVNPDTLTQICVNICDQFSLPKPFAWTNVDVIRWIDALGYPQYRYTFFKNLINGRTLLLLNASALSAMNIKCFKHIKAITASIRKLYEVEDVLFIRSISIPPRYPDTHYKFYRVNTELKPDMTRRSDLWRRMKILRPPPVYETHWRTLEKWLQHIPDYQVERIGYAPRTNLYEVKKARPSIPKPQSKLECRCMPPCQCEWTTDQLQSGWTLNYLKKNIPVEKDDVCVCVMGDEFEEQEVGEEGGDDYKCNCIQTCECNWNEEILKCPRTLTVMKIKLCEPLNNKNITNKQITELLQERSTFFRKKFSIKLNADA